jgi:dihydroorotate dehydrogenase (NAD+) catalytic subunit
MALRPKLYAKFRFAHMSQAPDLSAEFAGIRLKNPIIAASGTFGYGEEFARFVELKRIGAVVVKGTSAAPIAGNSPPRLFPTPSGMINAIGLENVGVDAFVREKMPVLREMGCVVFANVFGFTEKEYVEVVDKLNGCEGIAAYELNISCPNTERGGMMFGTNAQATQHLTSTIKARAQRPLIVKLSPNVTDIAEMGRAAEDGGADVLTVANTYLAMAIDTETFKPRINNITGGLSGPAIRPITLRMVYQCARAVKIPVIGLGGIFTAEDAVEYLLAGASAVQIGTANFYDPRAPVNVLDGLEKFMIKRGLSSLKDLIGRMQNPE